jgi:hypothetical protein
VHEEQHHEKSDDCFVVMACSDSTPLLAVPGTLVKTLLLLLLLRSVAE